jgi:hypothetical protein
LENAVERAGIRIWPSAIICGLQIVAEKIKAANASFSDGSVLYLPPSS